VATINLKIKTMTEQQNLTWNDIKAMFAETQQQFIKTDKRIEKQNKELNDASEKRHKQWNENFEKEREEWHKNYKKERKEWLEKFDIENKAYEKRIAYLERLVGGIGNNNGDMAEEFFFNAFRKDKIFMNEKYDKIKKGYFSSNDPYRGEFDIVFFNGQSVAIVEVKYKAKPDNINIETLTTRIERLKEYDPEYRNHNFYLGVAAMSFKKGLATALHKAGVATVHPVGKKMVIYDKDVKVF
jgi:hypothetical protein